MIPSFGKAPASHGGEVLVVDDDPVFRQVLGRRLTQLGAEVREATDGAAAWAMLKSKPADLALVDMEMPGVDGIGFIQCLRGYEHTRHIPVVMITSRSDSGAIQEALAAGATAYLTKPLQWSTFANCVEFLLGLSVAARKSAVAHDETRAQATTALAQAEQRVAGLAGRLSTVLTLQTRDDGAALGELEGVIAGLHELATSISAAGHALHPNQPKVAAAPAPTVAAAAPLERRATALASPFGVARATPRILADGAASIGQSNPVRMPV
jgi:CheY-like chemotaxis protein